MRKFKDYVLERTENDDSLSSIKLSPNAKLRVPPEPTPPKMQSMMMPILPFTGGALPSLGGAIGRSVAPAVGKETAKAAASTAGKSLVGRILGGGANVGRKILSGGANIGLGIAGGALSGLGYSSLGDAISNLLSPDDSTDGDLSSDDHSRKMNELRRILDKTETGLKEDIRLALQKYNNALIKATKELKNNLDNIVDDLTS